MFIATFVSSDPAVRELIEFCADTLADEHGVAFVCAVDEGYRPKYPYIAKTNDDLLLVLENVAVRNG